MKYLLQAEAKTHKRKKSKIFLETQMQAFLHEEKYKSNDYINMKMAMIVALYGCLRVDELVKLQDENLDLREKM